ncbi:hypothetical protein DID88_005846 [Monilinia fructigena]|uniref:Putative gamma-glutamylcyclotransferase n=1 Tax=Monilinia fructigena TaxID=38457 RepID=A0A395J251_9HELO|nr:hypothetical protein DID88_005846 [Monilinia fructigena]
METKVAEPAIPETYNAFFYGTLMAPEVLHRVIYGSSKHPPSASLTITPALLPDYCRHRVRYVDYPGIISEPGHTVRGTYVTGLTPKKHAKPGLILAPKEQEHVHGLSRIMAETVETGVQKQAQTYVFIDLDSLEKGEWDFEFFREEKLKNWADESEEYAEVDANAVQGNESKIGIFESLDRRDTTGGRGVKTTMSKELKELSDKKREEEWILEEKKRIAKEKRLECQCSIE